MEEDKKRRRLDPALQELKAAQDAKVPIVRLLASPDSYPFQEKVLRVTDSLNIGRSNLADIKNGLFDCPQVSATHATMNYKDGSFTIFDSKSKNGSYLNDYKLDATPVQIFCGDKLQFGSVGFNRNGMVSKPIIAFVNVFDSYGMGIYRPKKEENENETESVGTFADTESQKNQCTKAQFLKAHVHALSQFFRGW